MKPELQRKLFEKYDDIFRERNLPMTQTCMCWGIECGNGWYKLLDDLCKRFKAAQHLYGIEVIANQVKEKFGGLRFYYSVNFPDRFTKGQRDDVAEQLFRVCSKYESLSYHVCENCGSPGKLRNLDGWYVTLCDSCLAERQKEEEISAEEILNRLKRITK